VVDDCSTDGTGSLAEAAGAIVVRHTENRGYDGALNSGFAEAARLGFEYVITFDADGQHDGSILERFVLALDNGADLVIGIRPSHARIGEAVFSLYTRVRYGVCDPLCGLKGYRIDLYRGLGWFDSYRSIGTELTLYAVRRGCRYMQVPIPIGRRDGKPRFAAAWKAELKILRALALTWLH
jgi:glycosyltransferase involved in cell wall biosynthesis